MVRTDFVVRDGQLVNGDERDIAELHRVLELLDDGSAAVRLLGQDDGLEAHLVHEPGHRLASTGVML